MIYTILLDEAELALIGEALDAMPHGKVFVLHRSLQTQISQQEQNARDKTLADQKAREQALIDQGRTMNPAPAANRKKRG